MAECKVLGDPGNGPMCSCAHPDCCALGLAAAPLPPASALPTQPDPALVYYPEEPLLPPRDYTERDHAALVAMHHDYMLQRYAVLDTIDEADPHCPTCGGPAVVHVVGSSVYIRAPGVEPPPAAPHPAATGWQDGATE